MKKEASGKKGKLWLWIVIAVVLIAAIVAGIIFLPGLLGNKDAADDGMPKLYWNVDREANTDWDTGLSTRQPAEDGNYYVRFAHNGEQVELPVADKKLVNYIDSLDLMGLTLDENGFIIDVKPLADIASVIGEAVFVQNVNGDTIIANSSVAMNGRKLTIKLTESAKIYNVSGKGEFVGEAIEASSLNPMDTISIFGTLVPEGSEEEPVITHVYVLNKPVESAIYFRADQYYDSSNKVTTREPDENGAYTIKWYCNGETVDLKCKDKDLVTKVDSANYHWCHWGLEFDEEGYIIALLDSFLGSRTLMQCERYDITELDEDGNYTATSLIKNNGAYVQGTVGADCPIYDISSTAKAEGQANRRVDSLQLGDRVCIWTDTMGNPVHIYVTRRQADSVGYWVVTRSYDSTNKVTTRVPNANGYYEIELLKAGDTKNTIYYTEDIEVATAIDTPSDRCVGLKVGEGNMIEAVYDVEGVFGNTYMVRGYYVIDASASIATFLSPSGSGSTKNGVLAVGAKVWNVSTVGEYGAETALQVGDYVFAGKTAIGEVAYAYVVRRPLGEDYFYWRTESRQYDKELGVSTRERNEDGYFVYEFAHNGKLVTLRTDNQDFANLLDYKSSDPAYALEVKGDIITAVHDGLYACGGARINHWTVTSIDGDRFTAISSSGKESTHILHPDCITYNVSSSFVNNKGERATLKVGDIIAGYRDPYYQIKILVIKTRETNKMAWPVDPQYNSTNAVTTRTADKDGWYKIELAVDGKIRTYKTKNINVVSAADSYTAPFGIQVSGDELLYVSSTTYVENVKGAGVTGYTVKSASGSAINAIYTLGHSEKTGQTESLPLSSDAVIYDVTPEAMANGTFGQSVKLKAGDVIRTYKDNDGNHLYVYVIARNTREYYSYCDHCKKDVYWTPYVPSSGVVYYDTHYYVASDNLELSAQMRIYSTARDFETVLDLNGKTVFTDSANKSNGRIALVRYGDTLTIFDSVGGGEMYTINNTVGGGVLLVHGSKTDGTGVLNLHAGKYYMVTSDDFTKYPESGGILSSSGIVNMYDGVEIFGGMSVARDSDGATAGNVKNSGTFNMYGGKIYDGTAEGLYLDADGVTVLNVKARGGNVHNSGTFNMYDGEIYGGLAGRGGNVYVESGTFTMYKGKIVDGVADKSIGGSNDGRGGNIASTGDVYLKGGIVSGGTVIGAKYGGNLMTTGLKDCIYISDDAVVIDGYYKETYDSEPASNNIMLMYSNMVVSGGTIGDDADGAAISATGTDTGGGSSLTIAGGTITGKISLSGKILEGAKYEDYRPTLTLAGGNVPGTIDASNVKELNISGNPVVGKLTIGNTKANMGAMTAGANIIVNATGVISNPIADAAVANAIVNGNYLIPAANGMVVQLTADNALKILHPDAVSAPCEHCDGANADWIPWDGISSGNGHFVVNEDITLTDLVKVSGDMILDLNGKTVTAAEGKQAFYVSGTFSIIDSSEAKTGTLTGGNAQGIEGNDSTYYQRGGNVTVIGGTFNLYSGTISNGTALSRGGNLYVTGKGVINIYGGTVIGGETPSHANNIYVMYSTLNIFGGEIIDTAGNGIYNVRGYGYDGDVAKFNISGGSITGSALGLRVDGNDLAEVVISGGVIEGKVEIIETPSVIIEGNPVVEDLELTNTLITFGELTEGAQIGVKATGVFTAPFADATAAEAAAAYIVTSADKEVAVTANNALEIKVLPVATVNKYCEHCQQNVEFAEWYGTAISSTGHYVLMENAVLGDRITVAEDTEVVVDLNGYTLTAAEGKQAFYVSGTFSIIDSSEGKTGTITGGKAQGSTNNTKRGGNVCVNGGTFNLYSGTISNGTSLGYGGNLYVTGQGVINIYGGKVIGGVSDAQSNNIYSLYSTLNIFGGEIIDTASNSLPNIGTFDYNGKGAKVTITGGTISGAATALSITGADLAEVVISGGEFEGKLIVKKALSFIIEGNPVIEDLELTDTLVTFGELTEGAQIGVKATGIFTAPFADATAAEAAAAYIVTSADKEVTVTANNELEVKALPTATLNKYCEHCQQNVVFDEWYGTAISGTGHYVLMENAVLGDRITVAADTEVIVDLNGYTLTAAEGKQAFYVEGSLGIMDSSAAKTGTVTGGQAPATAADTYSKRGGNVSVKGGTFNLYSGTISNGTADSRGGNLYVTHSGTINIYGGKVIGGVADAQSNNIYSMYSTLNIFGGEIIDTADNDLPSIATYDYNSKGAKINISGGTISGSAIALKVVGDNLAEVVISGGEIEGNLLVQKALKLLVEGTPIIESLELSDTVLKVGQMADGASVKINATSGVFTDALTNANDVVGYFHTVDSAYAVAVNAENKLEVVEGCICGCGTPADQIVWTDAHEFFAAQLLKATSPNIIEESVHLKLNADINITEIYGAKKQVGIGGSNYDVNVTIDLNGYTWTSDYRTYIYEGSVLTFMDSSEAQTGIMSATGSQPAASGGVFINYGTLNIRGGTYTQPANGSMTAKGGVVYQSEGEFNFYYGTIIGGQAIENGTASGVGGNVYIRLGTFNMYDGSIIGGTVLGTTGTGGNVYIAHDSVFTMYGGVIKDGVAAVEPDIYLNDEAIFNNIGGTVGAPEAPVELCPCGCGTPASQVTWIDAMEYLAPRGEGYAELSKDDKKVRTAINENVHLILNSDIDIAELFGEYVQLGFGSDTTGYQITIDLNGHTWIAGNRRIYIYQDTALTILDSSEAGTGTLIGNGASSEAPGVFFVDGNNVGATLNIYSGTFTSDPTKDYPLSKGGIVYLTKGGICNMYGGTIIGGQVNATGMGGNVYINKGTFNMYDGIITGGTAAQGGNVYLKSSASVVFNMYGGNIYGGIAAEDANIFVGESAIFNQEGGSLTAPAELCPCGCGAPASEVEWLDANAYFAARAEGFAEMASGADKDAKRFINGENIHLKLSDDLDVTALYGSAAQIQLGVTTAGTVTIDLNGYTWSSNHRFYIYYGSELTIMDSSENETGVFTSTGKSGSGRVIINYGTLNLVSGTITMTEDGAANITTGGVVHLSGDEDSFAVFNMYGGSVINGRADGTSGKGGNVNVRNYTIFNMYGGTISGGTAAQGSNVYVAAEGTFNHEGGTIEDMDNTVYQAQ